MTVRARRLFSYIVLLPFLACSACSLHQQEGAPRADAGKSAPDDMATRIWRRYLTQDAAARSMSGPFRIAANLRYTNAAGENTRLASLLWGNGREDSPYPLRLDLQAGIGATAAKIREDAGGFIAFSPNEGIAYTREQDDRTLISFGVPIPLNLGELALLLTGHGGRLFLPEGSRADAGAPPEHSITKNGVLYRLPGAPLSGALRAGMLELSAAGVPISWREEQQGGWSLSMEPDEMRPLAPRKVTITHPRGESALIVVKDMSRVSPPYTAAQLDLALPAGTLTKRLP
jgi:hypothetical protein